MAWIWRKIKDYFPIQSHPYHEVAGKGTNTERARQTYAGIFDFSGSNVLCFN
jgi:hypothetical protein